MKYFYCVVCIQSEISQSLYLLNTGNEYHCEEEEEEVILSVDKQTHQDASFYLQLFIYVARYRTCICI